jgi:hypothetical protein
MRSTSGIRMTVSGTNRSRTGCIGEAASAGKFTATRERFAGGFIRYARLKLNGGDAHEVEFDAGETNHEPDRCSGASRRSSGGQSAEQFIRITFFLDGEGLKVLEPTDVPETEAQAGEIVSLANWSDASLTSLRPHEPEPTGVLIVLESRH